MGHVIAVMPASGGVGATTIAAAVAVRAGAAGRSVSAVDLDRFGGRLDVVLGLEQERGWRWDRLHDVDGVVDGRGLARELPRLGSVAVLAGGPGVFDASGWVATVPDVLAGLAAAHEVVVLDVPRVAGVIAAAAPFVDVWVVVVGTQVPQLACAAVSVPTLRSVVEARVGGSGSAGALGPAFGGRCTPWAVLRGARVDPLMEEILTEHLDVPVVASLEDDSRVVADAVAGVAPGTRGRGRLVEAADEVLLRAVEQPPCSTGSSEHPGRGLAEPMEPEEPAWRRSA